MRKSIAVLSLASTSVLNADMASAITDDIVQIYRGVQHCLELRRKYIRISLQRSYDNPKNNVSHWKIYPEPPRPRWTYNADDNTWHDHKNDMPKLGVGQDFKIEDCEIPSRDSKRFEMVDGVYQVYPDADGMTSLFPSNTSNRASCACAYPSRVLS